MHIRSVIALVFLLSTVPAQAYDEPRGYDEGQNRAENMKVDTSEFDNNLSSADDTVQHALNTIDELIASGGSSIILDLADNGANESTALSEIATSGDTNAIFSEPSADKLLIDLSKDWPKADTADDLTCTNCIGPTEITDLTLGTDTAGNYVASVAASSPLSGGAAGSEGAAISLSIADAAADGSTKGASSYTANDFNSSSGNISLDYTNGQAAASGVKGFLTGTDWDTFNNKVSTSRTITVAGTASEITSSAGAQDLSSNRTWTLSLPSAIDVSSKSLKIPSSTTLPATCSVGQEYMDTDATSGSRFYLCESTNTWTAQGASPDLTGYALLAGRASGQTLIGGTGTTDDLILQTTSGVGASGADMIFKVGNNGGTEAMRILNSGFVGIGVAAPAASLDTSGHIIIPNDFGYRCRDSAGNAKTLLRLDAGNNALIGDTAPTVMKFFAGGGGMEFYDNNASNINFDINANGSGTAGRSNQVVWTTGGLVGIGLASPTGNGFLQIKAGNQTTNLAKAGGVIFDHYADTSTTHTDGTEDDLYSDTLAASILNANGDKVVEDEYVTFVASATASRRVKKYFGGTLIFDSGSLTLSLGADFSLVTTVIRESSSVVRIKVEAASTSASSIPYVTYTRITGLTLTNSQILKTTGIASGTGAASGDILNKMGYIEWKSAA